MRRLSFLFLVACSSHGDPRLEIDPPEMEGIAAEEMPAPLAGGTLLEAHDGLVYASNPDTGFVDVIDPSAETIVWQARFPRGAEPGRLVESDDGLVHVVLRGAGAIATIDPKTHAVTTTDVCPETRGIAAGNGIWVACEGGELVRDGNLIARLGRGLRDIVVTSDRVYVTRLRSAELVTLGLDGKVISTTRPFDIAGPFQAEAAWRTLLAPDGSVYMLHQYATSRPIDLDPNQGQPAYGSSPVQATGDDCRKNHLVVAALTHFVDGHPSGTELFEFSTGIDMTIGKDGRVSIVHLPTTDRAMVQKIVPSFSFVANEPLPCQLAIDSFPIASGMAVATAGNHVQTRSPSMLLVGGRSVALSPSITNAGFDLFHTPTKVGLACASCHPEGGDDGHVWVFASLGNRRTQSLRGGVLDTAPLHWAGDETDLGDLVADVFTHRMGGGKVTPAQVTALGKWLEQLPVPRAPSGLDPDAIDRGRTAFDKAECATCHSGSPLTNNKSVDVGTGGTFQVPTLRGVGARAPFIHDGCAATLHDRLTDPACSGVTHGKLDLLSSGELGDLEVFLESL